MRQFFGLPLHVTQPLVMGWHGLYFLYQKTKRTERLGLFMKKKIVLFMTVGMMALTGCSIEDTTSEKIDNTTEKIASNSVGEESALDKINLENKEGFEETYENKEPKERQYTWQEMTIMLPEDWIGRCIIVENESGFSIYHKVSYEKDDSLGYICGFFHTEEPVEYNYGKTIIAYTEDGMLYYLVQPTDVSCDTEDKEISGEYIRMCQQVPQLKGSLQIAASGVHNNADEYILSTSSILSLNSAMLADLSDNNLWIARNEIYARHGRQFDNMYLQQYFNQCTWYEGKIPPQEFQEDILNQTERDNLQLLIASEKEYDRQHPYPKMYQASEIAIEDLNGDGKPEEITYQVSEQENGETVCIVTVNGETYSANGLSYSESEEKMTNPTVGCFYISDILENDGILEIAVIDEGPSEDPITYFFQYDSALSCIGQVPGIPFAEMNGGLNGFNGFGGITGCLRIDLIETAYLQDYKWYDGNRIIDFDMQWYNFLPSFGHILYEDLPVYCEWEETSATTMIPAQDEVFFLGTDMEQWILVKGKDGSQGYMLVKDGNIVELNKPAEEVFSGLQFSD